MFEPLQIRLNLENRMLKWLPLFATVVVAASPTLAQDKDTTLPDGAGKAIVQRMCVDCHSLKVVTAKHATKDQWATIVQQMVSRGADGTDQEVATVVDYLAKNFPPQKDDKPASSPSQSSTEQHTAPKGVSYVSFLTMPQTDVDAMFHHWRQAYDDSQSPRKLQQKTPSK
jgi:cytochrome c5